MFQKNINVAMLKKLKLKERSCIELIYKEWYLIEYVICIVMIKETLYQMKKILQIFIINVKMKLNNLFKQLNKKINKYFF